jgi:hypothetical protein
MNFKKLSKEKRQQLVLAVIGTVVVLGALGFGLIRWQYSHITKLAEAKIKADDELDRMERSISRKSQVMAEFADVSKDLSELEKDMAPAADPYSWFFNLVRSFRSEYGKVEIAVLAPTVNVEDMNLFPKFEYKQAVLSVSGKAHYHDLGTFLADVENRFPHMRVLNLDLKLNTEPTSGADRERLAFSLDFVALIRPTP